jgi:hypothetical protein
LKAGNVNIVIQMTPEPLPELSKVPLAVNLVRSDEARKLITAAVQTTPPITRLYAVPPGTPKDRVRTLQKSFMDTMKDPDFLAEAKKSNLEIDPTSGDGGGPIVVENGKGVFSRYPKKETGSWRESDRGGTRLCEKVHNVLAKWKIFLDVIC